MSERPYNELAQYFPTSPDPVVPGCLNTREHTDGVLFPGVEPLEATHCFIGRPSIVAAVAELYHTTVADIEKRLAQEIVDHTATIKDLEAKLKVAEAKLTKISKAL